MLASAASVAASEQGLLGAGSAHLVCTPASLRFGQVAVGQTRTQFVTLTNLGSSSVELSDAITSGGGFGIRGLDFPLILAGGQSFTFTSYFAPESKGESSGSVSFVAAVSHVSKPVASLGLSGTGTDAGRLTVTLARFNFGAARVGTHVIRVGTVTAANSAVTIFSAESSTPEFVLSGLSFPVTIPAGQGRQFTVVFEPRARGAATATVSFLSNAGSSPTVQSLTGTGIEIGPHSVDLSWNPSSLPEVAGYNVYRGLASGGPYTKINPVLDQSNAFTDNSVDDGATYYYVATAVNLSGQESAYSNEVQALIPPLVGGTLGTAPLHRRAGVPSESD